jgi:hypothetical protein
MRATESRIGLRALLPVRTLLDDFPDRPADAAPNAQADREGVDPGPGRRVSERGPGSRRRPLLSLGDAVNPIGGWRHVFSNMKPMT